MSATQTNLSIAGVVGIAGVCLLILTSLIVATLDSGSFYEVDKLRAAGERATVESLD